MTEAFLQLTPRGGSRIPLLVHVPHGSLNVPAPWRNDIVLSKSELARELLSMTDAHTFTSRETREGSSDQCPGLVPR